MDCQKHLFSLDDDHHYINCAYLSPMLTSVKEAGIKGIRHKQQPWKITPEHFFEDSNTLRSLFGELINAQQQDIALIPAASYGLATVAKNIDPAKGREIIIAGEQFPSNVYAWKRFCQRHDCQLKIIDAPSDFNQRGEMWNRHLLDTINNNTLMVALGNVHWADGTLFDLDSIGNKARSHNAYFVIDGTQSVGALPIDVQTIKPDALICAGYKWLMGPYGMSLGYFGEKLQDGIPLEEGWIARKNSEDFSSLVDYEDKYQPGAQRFDMGERSNFILVPMMIEALKQILEWDPQNIQQYCKSITANLVQELPEYDYRIEDPEWRGHHLFGIRLPETISLETLNQELNQQNIHVSVRGSAVRISPNVYNDERDVGKLLNVLKSISEE